MSRTVLFLWLLSAPAGALAQGKSDARRAEAARPGAPNVQYEKKTVVNFEDDTIQGDLTRPDGEYVDARRKVKHSALIKIREDFREEVLRSAKDL